jgi:hypothetical protein
MKIKFRMSEVKSFLELKVIDNVSTEEELELYENYCWNGKLEKNDTYKQLVREMNNLYNEKF